MEGGLRSGAGWSLAEQGGPERVTRLPNAPLLPLPALVTPTRGTLITKGPSGRLIKCLRGAKVWPEKSCEATGRGREGGGERRQHGDTETKEGREGETKEEVETETDPCINKLTERQWRTMSEGRRCSEGRQQGKTQKQRKEVKES